MPILQFVSIAVAFLLGVIVVIRNPADRNRWLLLLFNTSVGFWISTYIFADIPSDTSLLWNKMVFISALVMSYTGYLLIASLAGRLGRMAALVGVVLVGWSALVVSTPLIVDSITPRLAADGTIQGFNAIHGTGYFLYVLSLLAAAGGLIVFTFRVGHRARGQLRAQLQIIFAGFIGMLLVGAFTGILLPVVLRTSEPANFSFLSAFIIMGAFTYAIVRQRFFDIRAAVARSLGYFVSLGLITIFYTFVIFGIGDVLFGATSSDIVVRIYYIAAALFVAVTFQPLKAFVNTGTRRIFFRDAYDTPEVFGRLTSLLVRTVDLTKLTHEAAALLNGAIRADKLQIVLVKKKNGFGDHLLRHITKVKEWPLLTNDLVATNSELADQLTQANISLVSRLKTPQELVGYIICGHKVRGDVLTSQDIELIKTASDELAVAIQNALRFEEIAAFNTTLREQIAHATAELRQSNRKLKKLDQAKDEFISMASHQLRTPLTSVKGYLSMALEGDGGRLSPALRKLIEEAFMSSQRMVYLIGDFLNVSRLQTGKFMLELKDVNLADLVKEEIQQLATAAERRNITIDYQKPYNFPTMQLDDDKIRQVVMNFIDNALYYSKPGSKVLVALVSSGHDARLTVHDTGIGVPENERHNLFTKFYRAQNARKVRPDGTGIGLFMAKKVIAAHGGSIIFESREGRGSTFGFSVPLTSTKTPPGIQ